MSQTTMVKDRLPTAHCSSRKEFIASCKADNVAFLDTNRKRVYIEYVRLNGVDTGVPTGVFVAYRRDDGSIAIGWSAAHSGVYNGRKAEQFNKAIGLWKAIRRALWQGRLTAKMPNRLFDELPHFLVRAYMELLPTK